MSTSKVDIHAHVACIFTGTKSIHPLSIGYNERRPTQIDTTHAEHMAIRGLPVISSSKKVNIFIGKVGEKNSRPCVNCIGKMKDMDQKGYKINNVYYTSGENTVICKKFNALEAEPCQHVSSYFRMQMKEMEEGEESDDDQKGLRKNVLLY